MQIQVSEDRMSVIAAFMPVQSFRQVDRVAVAAKPERAYQVVRATDLRRLAFVRALFGLRTLPERAAGVLRPWQRSPAGSARIEDITRPGSGFILLAEDPGREVVLGSVGKFWQPTIDFAAVTPESFTAFSEPGYGKLAWCLRVDPRQSGGAWVTVELRVGATDGESLARFRSYWRLIGRFSRAIRHAVLRVLVDDLGAFDPEIGSVPGDEILPDRKFQRTHAIVIEAPPERVWPWLVQMGCRRAGWYSFDWLDNGRVPSAEQIVPELQTLSVGDTLPARPSGPDGFRVLQLEPARALVLGSPSPSPDGPVTGSTERRTTWAFLLEPIGDEATQLTVRVRADFEPGLKMGVLGPVIAAAHEVMERRQLHNLRRRAEPPRLG